MNKRQRKENIEMAIGLVDTILNSARVLNKLLDESIQDEIKNKGDRSIEKNKDFQEAVKDLYDSPFVKRFYIMGVKYNNIKIKI